ncbi:MAG: O-methyltransferase [Bacilli bacterium]|nr:O-methyltransferase [Bacilli bacterium]
MEFLELYPKIKEYALEHGTPIIMEDSLVYIKKIIEERKIKKILEIGTAIAYSALHFASVSEDVLVDTIERNPEMIMQATKNLEEYDLKKQIKIHPFDALECSLDDFDSEYDLLFIDAAKAQSQRFFERYLPLLKPNALIITDNMNFHNVSVDDENISKNLRNMLKKIQRYHDWLANHPDFTTEFIDLGDGLAITWRK